MTFKQKLNEGQIVELNGQNYRVEGTSLVPVVQRGPLGGEIKLIEDCEIGQEVYIKALIKYAGLSQAKTIEICQPLHCETNVPPRPTFTPMTAGEAAKVSGIAGRWVAVKVGKNDKSKVPLGVAITENGHSWLPYNAEILLIEGVDLP